MSDHDPDYDPMADFPYPVPGENVELGQRLANLEARMHMLATNLAGHALQEQRQFAALQKQVLQLSGQVGQVYSALRNVAGTDWAELSEEFGKSKKLTARISRWLVSKAKTIGAILGAIAAAWGVFHLGQGKTEQLPEPEPTEQHPSERGDLGG